MDKLFVYQNDGAMFLLKNKRCMLADQPGLGKTVQALTAVKNVDDSRLGTNVCVICPRTAVENWKREIKKWNANTAGITYLVTSFEQVVFDTPDRMEFLNREWDIAIVDEAHRLKNVGAKRTTEIYREIFKVKYVWLLTGTPARNHAGELWTHIKALRPDLIHNASGKPMDLEQFENKYCTIKFDVRGHRKVAGSKNMGELRTILETSGFFMRRLKKDVLKDLPDLIFDQYSLPGGPDILNHMKEADRKVLRNALSSAKTRFDTDDEMVEHWTNIESTEAFSTMMRGLGTVKAPLVADWVEEELEAPGKLIVFYKHTVVGDILAQRLAAHRPARVDGKTKDTMAEVDRFQDPDGTRVFLGQISACQEAINLTMADQCIFAEASWSPADNEQAACRGHRIGMQAGYVVRFANLAATMDEVVMRVLARKTRELNQLFG